MAVASDGEQGYWTQKILNAVEPIIFDKRWPTLGVLVAITVVLFVQMAQLKPDAGWLKSLPLDHPYMQTFDKYYKEFGGANSVLVALVKEEGTGDIYTPEFMETIRQATDDVFFINGVDRARVMSLFTPSVTYVEVVEGGLSGETVIPANYQPIPEIMPKIKSNVGKAQIVGRLVTNEQNGAMIVTELLEFDPQTGEKLDYQVVGKQLEALRDKYEVDGVKVHLIGFAKIVDDMANAALEVAGFFLLALLMTGILLWIYTGSLTLSILPLVCSIVAVIWEMGLVKTAGFGLDPFAILVPFLVMSVSVSHGVQYVNAWVAEVDKGATSFDASLETFRRLAIPGTTALITDVAGFATIYLINIQMIREMSLNAAFGVAAIIITNKMLMPIWLTVVKIKDMDKFRAAQIKRENMMDGLAKTLAKATRPKQATTILIVCAVCLGWALYKKPFMKVGDAMEGVPELRPDSRFNQDFRAITANFDIGVDIFKVIAETKPNGCVDYEMMAQIDQFEWHMENMPGVASSLSLLTFAKLVYQGLAEGRLNTLVLPRNKFALAQATALVPTSAGMLNDDCDAMAVWLFTEDHKADTIEVLVHEVKEYNKKNAETFYAAHPEVDPEYCQNKYDLLAGAKLLERRKIDLESAVALEDEALMEARKAEIASLKEEANGKREEYATFESNCPINFALASGNVGVMAAVNEVVEEQEVKVVLYVYAVVLVFLWLSFHSIPGVLCVVLPLTLVSIMAYGVMAVLDIGLKVATLPVVALAVGIGVDYGIYVYSEMAMGIKKGLGHEEAYRQTLHRTGKAVLFTGVSLGLSVMTWVMSELQFQIDMGVMLMFMFTANMFGALLVLPALASFLVNEKNALG